MIPLWAAALAVAYGFVAGLVACLIFGGLSHRNRTTMPIVSGVSAGAVALLWPLWITLVALVLLGRALAAAAGIAR
jgi:hypothetical protein